MKPGVSYANRVLPYLLGASIILGGSLSMPLRASAADKEAAHAAKAVTDANFQKEVVKSKQPVLVDFWAVWCGPCKMMSPVVEELAKELKGKVKVVKLNTDENPKTAKAYQIRGIPSLYLFKDGKVVEQVVGAVPKEELLNAINKHL